MFGSGLGDYAEEHFDLATLPVEFGGEGIMGCLEEIKEGEAKAEDADANSVASGEPGPLSDAADLLKVSE